mgnify:FL=1
MPRASYQYETSPRKYEPEYTNRKKATKTTTKKAEVKKQPIKANNEKKKAKKIQERKSKLGQMIMVFAIFGMLFTVSYREISIMEMFQRKKDLQNQLAVIEKENGQVEKSITEVESSLDWNSIQQKATNELGMQKKAGIPVDLDKSDNVETNNKFIKEEKDNFLEKVISFFINNKQK